MKRWLDPAWYRFLWYRRGPEERVLLTIVVLAALAGGGIFTVRALATRDASTAAYVPLTTTVVRRVKMVEHGRTVYRRLSATVLETRTIATPGGTVVVTRPVVRDRVVYRRHVVLVHGKPVTVSRPVTRTALRTNTQLLTVTNERTSTVVDPRTETLVQTRTLAPETVTVTGPTETVTKTVVTTVTEPAVTVTVTLPGTGG
jgi:hypothetical protein